VKSTKIPEDIIVGKTSFDNLQQTFKKLMKMNLVPCQTDCILDLGASSRFATFKINMAPTLTASRCASQGYYSTKQMRKLSLSELMRLQGCDPKRFKTSGLTKTQLGSIIGNAMSVNVMEAVIEKSHQDDWGHFKVVAAASTSGCTGCAAAATTQICGCSGCCGRPCSCRSRD
jgi:hypothetical protein